MRDLAWQEETLSSDEIRKALKAPSDFGYSGENAEMFHTWALGPVIQTRDSTLLDQSNAAALKRELATHPEWEVDYEITGCGHWAVGWVDHLSYRVVDDKGEPTEIARFLRAWFEYLRDQYPVADESDYSAREWAATLDNIGQAGRRFLKEGAPDTWVGDVARWFDDHDSSALESRDDQGGYPSNEQIKEALGALGYLESEE